MAQILKQSTTVTVNIGPFVDATDAVTEETGLAGSMTIELSKAGAAFAVRNSATAITHDTGLDGHYRVELDTTDTNTIGPLRVAVQDNTTHLPVWHEFQVVEEEIYDSLYLSGATALATSAEVASISSVGGGSINYDADGDNTGGAIKTITFVGSQTNTYTSTSARDGTFHTIDDTANEIDIVYSFDIGGGNIASQVAFDGYLDGSNDELNVLAYDFVGTDWDQIGVLSGQVGSANFSDTYPLFVRHTGTSADLGKVYIRFQNTAQSNPQLNVDRLLCSAVSNTATVGYVGGAVWVDTSASNTNTENYVDGVADNPVSTIAAAKTIADSLNLKVFHLMSGSSITLAATFDDYEFRGYGYTVALGGQSVSGTLFENGIITGNDDGANTSATVYRNCLMGTNTLGLHRLDGCGLSATITLAEAGTFDWVNCHSRVAGTGTPSVDIGVALLNTNLNMRNYSGGIEIQQFGQAGTDNMSLEGTGQLIINANCTGGTVAIRGNFTVTDNAGGAVTLSDNARIDTGQINTEVSDVIKTDTISEMAQQAPPATPTMEEAVMYIYMALRNRLDVDTTAGFKEFYNDAGTVIHKKAISDDGNIYTEAESETGP